MTKKIGLALGSGGIRGFTHIGVLKVLEKNEIPVDFIAGSSAGAVAGAAYAFYQNAQKVEDLFLSLKWRKTLSLLDFSLQGGIIKGEKIKSFIRELTKDSNFSDLKIPFSAVATEIETGKPYIFQKGELEKALLASCAFPFVFKPVEEKGKLLMDGGLSNPVPADVVKEMGAEIVIGVNLDNASYLATYKNKMGSLKFFAEIIQKNLSQRVLENYAEVVIAPKFKNKITLKEIKDIFDQKAKELIRVGEEETLRKIEEIKKFVI